MWSRHECQQLSVWVRVEHRSLDSVANAATLYNVAVSGRLPRCRCLGVGLATLSSLQHLSLMSDRLSVTVSCCAAACAKTADALLLIDSRRSNSLALTLAQSPSRNPSAAVTSLLLRLLITLALHPMTSSFAPFYSSASFRVRDSAFICSCCCARTTTTTPGEDWCDRPRDRIALTPSIYYVSGCATRFPTLLFFLVSLLHFLLLLLAHPRKERREMRVHVSVSVLASVFVSQSLDKWIRDRVNMEPE